MNFFALFTFTEDLSAHNYISYNCIIDVCSLFFNINIDMNENVYSNKTLLHSYIHTHTYMIVAGMKNVCVYKNESTPKFSSKNG